MTIAFPIHGSVNRERRRPDKILWARSSVPLARGEPVVSLRALVSGCQTEMPCPERLRPRLGSKKGNGERVEAIPRTPWRWLAPLPCNAWTQRAPALPQWTILSETLCMHAPLPPLFRSGFSTAVANAALAASFAGISAAAWAQLAVPEAMGPNSPAAPEKARHRLSTPSFSLGARTSDPGSCPCGRIHPPDPPLEPRPRCQLLDPGWWGLAYVGRPPHTAVRVQPCGQGCKLSGLLRQNWRAAMSKVSRQQLLRVGSALAAMPAASQDKDSSADLIEDNMSGPRRVSQELVNPPSVPSTSRSRRTAL